MDSSRTLDSFMSRRGWLNRFDSLPSLYEQEFGTGLFDTELYPYPRMPNSESVLRPRTCAVVQSSSESDVKNEKNKLQVMLNVSQFKPNEIEVEVIDNCIVIHGKHEEISDEHGFIQREFTRRYMLPAGTEAETVKSSLSADGVLIIVAPNYVLEASESNERVFPILLFSEEETSG